jgi:alkanesulfonate monooxygenase SsuD/methylene tetrahydromethanopterin reductase-like flavin-dependent oxidoreductase (luciferase family)
MRFGICYNVEYREEVHKSPSHYLGQILEQVDLLEQLGYDTVWFSEHHCGGYSFGNPAVIASHVAARTQRIRIGTGVSLLPIHQPIFLAEEYGLLDVLSGGRLEYGVGRGYLMQEYGWLGIPPEESHERYHEAAELIIKAWTSDGRPLEHRGKHFDARGYTYTPRPVQRPYPPIYASAGSTLESFRWAAEQGHHLGTALFMPDLDGLERNVQLYRQELAAHGHDPASRRVMGITQMYCAADHEEALRDGRVYTENYWRFFAELSGPGPIREFYSRADALQLNARGNLLIGDPAHLTAAIESFRRRLGLDLILMEVAQGGAPHDKICSALETFARGVFPNFR